MIWIKLILFIPFKGWTWFKERWALEKQARALGISVDDLLFRESVARYLDEMTELEKQRRTVKRRIARLEQAKRPTIRAVEKGWIENPTPSKS